MKTRRDVLSASSALAAISLLAISGCVSVDQGRPGFVATPIVEKNPNPKVPLAAIVSLQASEPSTARLSISDGERFWTKEHALTGSGKESFPLIGLKPDRDHVITITLTDQDGLESKPSSPIKYRTPALPTDSREWPKIELTQSVAADRLEPGATLISLRRRTPGRAFLMTPGARRFTEDWGLLLALDAKGEVVWYYKSPSRIGGIEMLSNGNLFFHREDFATYEIDLLGNVVRCFYAEKRPDGPLEGCTPIKGIETLHHQPHETKAGTFLAFSANKRVIENYYTDQFDINAPRKTQDVMGDTIIEFDRDGNIIWEWNTFDYLDVFRVGYDFTDPYWWVRGFPGALDWTHGNGVSEDPRDGGIVFYLKHQDAAIKVDRETKEIVWIFGEPTDWPEHLQDKLLKKVGDFKWPYHAHNPRMTNEGTLILFENGQWGARPFTGDTPLSPNEAFSRGAEYEIDETAMTVKEIWTSHKDRTEDACHSPGMGDAHRLPTTGNILVVDPVCIDQSMPLTYTQRDFSKRHVSDVYQDPRIREYSRMMPSEVLWELKIRDPLEVLHWQVYGGFRTTAFDPPQSHPNPK